MTKRLFSLLTQVTIAYAAMALLMPAAARAQALPVKAVEFDSASISRAMKYNIVLPANYEKTSARYPVLYLLHGLSGNYTHWSRMGVPAYARAYDLIVVMADGGNSWYVNWAKSNPSQKNNWEDAMVKDLVGHVDANFRTIAKREGRAINGLSMGGYGGLMLGLRHPDLFCSIGSHSGAVGYARQVGERLKTGTGAPKKSGKTPSTTPDPKIGIEGFSSQAERTPKGQMFTSPEECAAYDPFQLVLTLKRDQLPHIYLDCGTEDFLYKDNAALAKILLENKIPHTFAQSSGGHDSAYWAREVGHSMAVQYAIMQRQLAKTQSAAGGGKEKQ
jgi:putative tributyrin esterase